MFNQVLFHSDAFAYFDTDANPISCVVATTNGHAAERAQAALADEYGLPKGEFNHAGTVEAGDHPEAAGMVEHPDHAGVWL